MSEFWTQALPIVFMYGCVALLGPFVAIAMWMAFDGDRLREDVAEDIVLTSEARTEVRAEAPDARGMQPQPREATSAA
jgi:hypothetical protein